VFNHADNMQEQIIHQDLFHHQLDYDQNRDLKCRLFILLDHKKILFLPGV